MNISKYQKSVINLITNDGYTLKYQNDFPKSGTYWVSKSWSLRCSMFPDTRVHSVGLRKSTATKLIQLKLIKKCFKDKFGHVIFKPTELAKGI